MAVCKWHLTRRADLLAEQKAKQKAKQKECMDLAAPHSQDEKHLEPTANDDAPAVFLGRFELDADVRRTGQGRTLLGGTPFRLLRFSGAGAQLIDDLVVGKLLPPDPPTTKLVGQLVEGGLAHPVITPREPKAHEVTVVIPVFGDVDGLQQSLAAIAATYPDMRVIVVDDGSPVADSDRIAEEVDRHPQAELVRLPSNVGPAAARNAGWRLATTPLVAFLDADVIAQNWLRPILGHFDTAIVGAVAPRVNAPNPQRSRPVGSTKPASALNRYERVGSSLDRGSRPGRIAPRSRVSYAPAAALLMRRSVLEILDGFDETLRYGEDVDLLWRLDAAGYHARYDPSARVEHRNRHTWTDLAAQRMSYGTAAADLDQRHPGSVAPVELRVEVLAAWLLLTLGGKAGVASSFALGVGGAARLRETLRNHVDDPTGDALDLTRQAHGNAGKWLAAAVTRTWLPFAVVGSVFSRRVRRATAAAIVLPAASEWLNESPDLDLARWTAARTADHASYNAGVLKGVAATRSAKVLLPKVAWRRS